MMLIIFLINSLQSPHVHAKLDSTHLKYLSFLPFPMCNLPIIFTMFTLYCNISDWEALGTLTQVVGREGLGGGSLDWVQLCNLGMYHAPNDC